MNYTGNKEILTSEAIALLKLLISTPSLSKQENKTAEIIFGFLQNYTNSPKQLSNNIWVRNKFFNDNKPTILLNSHHDTVPPNASYTLNPYEPIVKDNKLFGLGSNDAGASLVSLLATFLYFYHHPNLAYNLIFAATSEEEISGKNGVELLLPMLGKIDVGIVGEPTNMQMAIAEKGLLVVDVKVQGKPGHAARNEGENAIYKAIEIIQWCKQYKFTKVSPLLGEVLMNVTIINAGSVHNAVPDVCCFTIDIRLNELYTHEEVLEILRKNIEAEITPRSVRIKSTSISNNHVLVKSGLELGLKTFGSATTSDKALMNFPTLKMGPGESARSHSANEFVYINEVHLGIETYIKLLEKII